MSELLQWPLRRVLRAGIDDLATARIWQRLDRSRRAAVLRGAAPRRFVALVSLAVFALGAFLVWLLVELPTANPSLAGPLRLAAGGELEGKLAAQEEARTVDLSDRSAVLLRPQSSLEVLENDGKAFVTLLPSGGARFDVRPGGPRRWTIECGFATVEVVGTRFSIRRDPTSVHVDVEHGIVLVRSDRIVDHIRRLTDGQSLDVLLRQDRPPASDVPSTTGTPSPPSAAPTDPPPPGARWRELAARGRFTEAYGLLGSGGVNRISEVGAVRDLLTVADVARLSGHPREAIPPLRRILEDHPDDPGAPLAAFTLGRVQLDALGDAADAADSFARALALHVPPGLEEDAYVRLVEARARAGDVAGARRAADEYRLRFPQGALSHEVIRWAGAP
jgi:transmembrane sensor